MATTTIPDVTRTETYPNGTPKREILLNAFDMCTPGHLSPGQWKNPKDASLTKTRLDYWINLAKILEEGDINALFLADTTGGFDTYQGSMDECIRRGTQWPMGDPSIPITAMAAVTKNLAFGITASTSFDPPYMLAKRFSTLDHFTDGRIAWNIVTSWKKAAFKAIGIDSPTEHDERYVQADEYLELLYKLWEGSWSDRAVLADRDHDELFDPNQIRAIHHHGKYYKVDARHICAPSPQRTPFLFQAGTSSAGSAFGGKHAEAVFVSGHSPEFVAPRVKNIRQNARDQGRDPRSVKVFPMLTPIIAATDEEAKEKLAELKKYASTVGGMVMFSGWTGIDLSRLPIDKEITAEDANEVHRITSQTPALSTKSDDFPIWTPRAVAEKTAIGGLGPVAVGSPSTVADILEKWVRVADVDGFNIGYVHTPGTFEDVVRLLVPELRRRGLYAPKGVRTGLTAREKVYGKGQSRLRDDHPGSRFRYDVYDETIYGKKA